MSKTYLGDSVYCEWDGFYLTLTTENGEGPSNIIHLEPQVQAALVDYIERMTRGEIQPSAGSSPGPMEIVKVEIGP